MSEEKTNKNTLSRREFLRNAGIVVGSTTVGSAFFLTACGETVEVTKTVTNTAPGTTKTVTSTLPGTISTVTSTQTEVTEKYICPVCSQVYNSLDALKEHYDTEHVNVFEKISVQSAHIEVDEDKCADCARCLMACSAYHHNEVSLVLSGIKWEDDNQLNGYRPAKPIFCQQCNYPECYFACPLKDQALCIDPDTGVKYINSDKCNGCGECVKACPFDPPRISCDMFAPIAERKAFKCDLCQGREGGPVCIEVCDKLALKLVTTNGGI